MRNQVRSHGLSVTVALILALAAGCGERQGGSAGETRETAPAWTSRFVRGGEAGLAKAHGSGRGAMLVVSASW